MMKPHVLQHGFTLVELVVTMVIIGILAAYTIPRFFDTQSFSNRGFYTEVLNAVRYAQQHAVATNCDVQVTLAANSYSLQRRAMNCSGLFNANVSSPFSGGGAFAGNDPDVTISPTPTFFFNALGAPSIATTDFTVGGYSFRVHAGSGYIEEL